MAAAARSSSSQPEDTGGGEGGEGGQAPAPSGDDGSSPPQGPIPNDILDQILDLPPEALDQLPDDLQDQLGGNQTAPQPGGGAGAATDDLLDFLFN